MCFVNHLLKMIDNDDLEGRKGCVEIKVSSAGDDETTDVLKGVKSTSNSKSYHLAMQTSSKR